MFMGFNHKDLGMRLHACNPSILGAEARRWQPIEGLADDLHREFKAHALWHTSVIPALGRQRLRIRSRSWLHLVQKQIELHETLFQKNHKQFNKNMGLSRKVCPPTLMEHLGLWEEVCIFQVSQCDELVVGVGDLAQW